MLSDVVLTRQTLQVAMSSSLAMVFQLGWSDLTDEGEFALQAPSCHELALLVGPSGSKLESGLRGGPRRYSVRKCKGKGQKRRSEEAPRATTHAGTAFEERSPQPSKTLLGPAESFGGLFLELPEGHTNCCERVGAAGRARPLCNT